MTIKVNVLADKAQAQMAALRASQAGLNRDIQTTNRSQPLGARHISSLMKFGNQLQWTGRMLQYNFTLPLLIAGAAATKFYMDQEKAMVHVAKVYGSTSDAVEQFTGMLAEGGKQAEKVGQMYEDAIGGKIPTSAKAAKAAMEDLAGAYKTDELEALDRAFTAISNHYGVQKKEVLEVAGAWAAAGQSGRALADSVDATMQAIIIGDMDATAATKALISIQAQYNLSSEELMATLASLNSVENQTGASMQDLITGFEKAAGVAREAGIETQQLAAYMAALVPATGSAASAGNALKTIISRLMSPTKEAKQVMEAMGLEVTAISWQSSTAAERLKIMAHEFNRLGKAGKNAASSVIASRWQVNRFSVLMREMESSTGFYVKGMKAAENQGESFKRMQEELNTVLQSDPRAIQRSWVMIQNAMVKVVIPLVPFILYVVDAVGRMADAFANMDPHMQKFILFGLVALAAVGPIVRYSGALTTLFAVMYIGALRSAAALGIFTKIVKMITFMPLLKGLSIFAGWIGGTTGLVATQAGTWRSIYLGMLGFFSKWTITVAGIFRAGALLNLAITIKGWVAQLAVHRIGFATSLLSLKLWKLKWTLLWAAATLETPTRWAAMWLIMKTISAVGWASLAATGPMKLVVGLFMIMRSALITIWASTWSMLKVISAAGWALIRAQWLVQSILGIGIFSRMRTALIIIWTTTAAASAGIWRGIALTMVLFSRAGVVGVIAVFKGLIPFMMKFAKVLFGPWGIALAVVTGLFYAFRDQIAQIFNNIVAYIGGAGGSIGGVFTSLGNLILGVFYKLPQGIQSAMVAVVTIIRDAALAVYDWFSYINPFAQHSPSLVDNVTNGMSAVLKQFGRLSGIKSLTQTAYAEIKKFGDITRSLGVSQQKADRNSDRKTLKDAGAGGALKSYNKLIAILDKLSLKLKQLEKLVAKQQFVVDAWQKKVDKANEALERQQKKLEKLQGAVDKWSEKLAGAEGRLDYFASAPLKGMQEMEDQIHANTMAQTALKLEMMDFEDVFGTYDDLKKKIDDVSGAQEILSGTRADLRNAGAGSEILKTYDQQIKKLDEQKDTYAEAADKLAVMSTELEKLQRQAERLDLVKAMKFDDLLYQIDKAANAMKELSFDEIMAGIVKAQDDISNYTDKLEEANAALEAQQAIVDALIAIRDNLQSSLDAEQAKLDALKDKYDAVNSAIQAINTSIQDVISAASEMADKLKKAAEAATGGAAAGGGAGYVSPGLQNFLDAGNADFPDPGGAGIPIRTDWSSQAGEIDAFTNDLATSTADMFATLNPFSPFKDKFLSVWGWIKDKSKNVAGEVVDFFSGMFDGVSFGGGDMFKSLRGVGEFLTGVFKDAAKIFKWAWDLLGPEVIGIGKNIWNGLKSIWEQVGPELAKFKDLVAPLGEAIGNIWMIMKPILAVVIAALLGFAKVVLSILKETIFPVFEAIGGILAGVIKVIRGFVQIIVGIFTLDFAMIWDGVKNVFGGAWDAIVAILKGAVGVIFGVVEGIVKGIWGFFVWLWDVLVGHSVVPDIVNGIIAVFHWLADLADWVWDNVLKPIWNFFVDAWDLVKSAVGLWWTGITTIWKVLWTLAKWWWDNILKPIFDKVVDLWNDFIKPALAGWWAGIQIAWSMIKTAAVWWWENVLKPIFTKVKELWDTHIKPELGDWWNRIQVAWAVLKTVAIWVWDNVLKPVFNKFKELWTDAKAELGQWRERIENAWNALTNLGNWIKTNVMDPIFNAIKTGWTNVKNWLTESKDFLLKPAKAMVNGVISAINFLIKGLNKIAEVLPGFDWKIEIIPEFAEGGAMPTRRVGAGFKTNGARAIVGEGKANHPEYVIPTDPTYRRRAQSLLADAAGRIGMTTGGVSAKGAMGDSAKDAMKIMGSGYNLPAYSVGGVMGGLGDFVEGAWDGIKDLSEETIKYLEDHLKDAVSFIVKPAQNLANSALDNVGWEIPREMGKSLVNSVGGWALEADGAVKTQAEGVLGGGPGIQSAIKFAQAQAGKPYIWGGVGPEGYDCSGFMSALANVVRGQSPYGRLGATATFPWGGFSGGVNERGFTIGSNTSYAGGIGHMAGTLAGVNVESSGGVGVRVGSSARGYNDSGFNQVASLTAAANGAIIRASSKGSMILAGEGGKDEAVIPLPAGWRNSIPGKSGGGDVTNEYNFHGDLSFPNITDPNDAKTFIDNLKSLAGGAA